MVKNCQNGQKHLKTVKNGKKNALMDKPKIHFQAQVRAKRLAILNPSLSMSFRLEVDNLQAQAPALKKL